MSSFELPDTQFFCITVGLPGSGKSTWAKRQVSGAMSHEAGYPIVEVNRDDLRRECCIPHGNRKHEKKIRRLRDQRIIEAIGAGKSVICSDTNLIPSTVDGHRKIAEAFGFELLINDTFLDVPVHRCIQNDLKRPNPVGKDVIEKMYAQYWSFQPKPENFGAPAIIVDLDGTLALTDIPYPAAYDRDYRTDRVNMPVLRMVQALSPQYKVVLLSGRSIKNPQASLQTKQWLQENFIPHDALFMREAGDDRDDSIVKKELYLKHVQGRYGIVAAFDDRPRVVRMWRHEVGLPVFHVADNIEF